MRIFVCSLMMAAVCGCSMKDDAKPAVAQKSDEQQTGNKPKGRSPGGMAGLVLPGDDDPRPAGNGGQNQTPQQPAAGQPNSANIVNTIPKDQARFLEWPKAKQERPGLEVVEDTPQGGDYLSFLGSAFVTLRSKPQVLNFQHQLDIMKEINEGNPVSLKQYEELAAQMKIDFNKQPTYRYYGYDTKTGKLVMLEDKIQKQKIYEEKGIPYKD